MEGKISNKLNKILLNKIRSKYILMQIFENLSLYKYLSIIKYNKELQEKLNKTLKDYEVFTKIEIEIFPFTKSYRNEFIHIPDEKKYYYHIYFDDIKIDLKRNYFIENENVTKIRIIIDLEIKSLSKLFYECDCIKKINFIKFYRRDINDMSFMFYGCSSLIELNLSNFNTMNVTNMSNMFSNCFSLIKLNLNSFKTTKVTNMSNMFYLCKSLKKLYINNFNVDSVTDFTNMFDSCWSLKRKSLDIYSIDKRLINLIPE